MKTESQRTCPSCGNEFSGEIEFCPVCMLRRGLAGGVVPGESSVSEDTVEPTTPNEPARRFEHYELVTGEDGKPVEWVAVRWGSLTKRSTSICTAP
jgi:hypothetical protein